MLLNYFSAWLARFNAPPAEPPHSHDETLVCEADFLADDFDIQLEAEPGSTGAAIGISAGFYT